MYQVLLVDDEFYVIEGLRDFVKWEDYGFVVCGYAGSGSEAARKIVSQQPDLVITDVRMPAQDGIELVSNVCYITNKPCKFIILSGYDKFEYVQSAISLNVAAYLLKPIDIDEMHANLKKIRAELDQEQRYRLVEKGYNMALQYYFDDVCSNRSKQENSLNAEIFLDFVEQKSFSRLILFHLLPTKAANYTEEQTFNFVYLALKLIMRQDVSYGLVKEKEGRICLILALTENDGWLESQLLEWLSNELLTRNGIAVKAFVSSRGYKLQMLAEQYEEVAECAQNLFYCGATDINYAYNAIETAPLLLKDLPPLSLPCDNLNEPIEYICNDLLEWLELMREQCISPKIVRSTVLKTLSTHGIYAGELWRNLICMDFEEIKRQINNILESSIKNNDNDATQKSLMAVCDYINTYYTRPIKLSELAQKFYFNVNYLGKALSQKFGMPVNQYIHFLRIQQAKKLLAKNELQISEIAAELGYTDCEYFTNKFKTFETMTPYEYRKRRFENK